ncbi:MAG: NADH-quinone oxidoreductase subunit B family protein [Candidatus Methanofastidiosia archaeon]
MIIEKLKIHCLKKSPWIIHVGAGSCNNCLIEALALIAPKYDIERFGGLLKGSPRHADILLVTGCPTYKMKDALIKIYEQMPSPKIVVAQGSCAISNGMFYDSEFVYKKVDEILPVDIYIPGCPPRPEAILFGITKALVLLEDRRKKNE